MRWLALPLYLEAFSRRRSVLRPAFGNRFYMAAGTHRQVGVDLKLVTARLPKTGWRRFGITVAKKFKCRSINGWQSVINGLSFWLRAAR